jgi:hypothetical protein
MACMKFGGILAKTARFTCMSCMFYRAIQAKSGCRRVSQAAFFGQIHQLPTTLSRRSGLPCRLKIAAAPISPTATRTPPISAVSASAQKAIRHPRMASNPRACGLSLISSLSHRRRVRMMARHQPARAEATSDAIPSTRPSQRLSSPQSLSGATSSPKSRVSSPAPPRRLSRRP